MRSTRLVALFIGFALLANTAAAHHSQAGIFDSRRTIEVTGVIESVSAYLIGGVYKDIVVYSLFLCFLWFRPQGLMGKM